MNPLGGEIAFHNQWFRGATDSGRSSLRLILEGPLRRKKFLIPDYLCGIIVEILRQYEVRFSFYHVGKDLSLDWNEIRRQKFGVLYVIDYFGQFNRPPDDLARRCTVIYDQVFAPGLDIPVVGKDWVVFNSLRKVTFLADGSLIASSKPIARHGLDKEAQFPVLKYEAKNIKYDFLRHGRYSEGAYLRLFQQAERKLDRQQGPFRMSMTSIGLLGELYGHQSQEYQIRRRNFALVHQYLKPWAIPLKPQYPCFYIFKIPGLRDELRDFLFKRHIFLPVHWPKIAGVENSLYDQVLSIPLDSHYAPRDLKHIAGIIAGFLQRNTKRRFQSQAV